MTPNKPFSPRLISAHFNTLPALLELVEEVIQLIDDNAPQDLNVKALRMAGKQARYAINQLNEFSAELYDYRPQPVIPKPMLDRDIRDYQVDLLNVLHRHGTPVDWCHFNPFIERALGGACTNNPAARFAYYEAMQAHGMPYPPTSK